MDEVLAWVQEVNKKGEELDDLCSATHPTAWHEDPDIVEAKKEWKEVAGRGGEAATAVRNGLLEDVQPKVGKSRRVVATQLTLSL